jgi:hypothetical protein
VIEKYEVLKTEKKCNITVYMIHVTIPYVVNLHLYHYAGIGQRSDSELQANNPVKHEDPTGMTTVVNENDGHVISVDYDDTWVYCISA